MEYDRLPLMDVSSTEFLKMLSVSVLGRGAILIGMLICGDSEIEYIWSKNIFVWLSFL